MPDRLLPRRRLIDRFQRQRDLNELFLVHPLPYLPRCTTTGVVAPLRCPWWLVLVGVGRYGSLRVGALIFQ